MTTLLLAIAIGLAVGLALGALGGGGGVLTVPALVYLLGEPAHDASTASLVIVGFAALAGLPAHALAGNVRWVPGLVFGVVGTGAALGATAVARHIDPDALLLVFALVILASAALMIRDAAAGRRRERAGAATAGGEVTEVEAPVDAPPATAGQAVLTHPGPAVTVDPATPEVGHRTRSRATQAALVVLGGLAVGLLTGVFGVGGGFLAVPLLVLIMRWPMSAAVGTSLLVIVINSAASLAARVETETVDWRIVVPVGIAAVIGTLAGKLVTDRVSGPTLCTAFGGTLVALAVYTGVRSVLGLLG